MRTFTQGVWDRVSLVQATTETYDAQAQHEERLMTGCFPPDSDLRLNGVSKAGDEHSPEEE
jgi:hypothetical protein